mmetsp:Transcript_67431/g.179762  ORF Transcript_67431/g.179762 Transcript_67431/m.179762 type:complete len:333 (-) Transcript_67431:78-1076(-)
MMLVKNTFIHMSEDEASTPRGQRSSSIPPAARLSCSPAKAADQLSVASTETPASSQHGSPCLSPSDSPRSMQAQEADDLSPALRRLLARPSAGNTTIMVRNVPNKYTQRMLLKVWKGMGFARAIDLFFLPVDLRDKANLGYCFVNFVSEEQARLFCEKVDGMKLSIFRSWKILETAEARVQGFAAALHNFRNSSAVACRVAPEFRPVIFDPETGSEVPFPESRKSASAGARPAAPAATPAPAPAAAPAPRRQPAPTVAALGARLFTCVSTVLDEVTARMVTGQVVQGYQMTGKRAELQARVEQAEQSAEDLQALVQEALHHLMQAGWLMCPQ